MCGNTTQCLHIRLVPCHDIDTFTTRNCHDESIKSFLTFTSELDQKMNHVTLCK